MYKPIDEAYRTVDTRRLKSRDNDLLITFMLDSLRAAAYDRTGILHPLSLHERQLIEKFLLSFTTAALSGKAPA